MLILSLASLHVLYILSTACQVCLVALSIISAVWSDRSRSGLIHLVMAMAISLVFWAVTSCSSRVAMAQIPFGRTLGGAQ